MNFPSPDAIARILSVPPGRGGTAGERPNAAVLIPLVQRGGGNSYDLLLTLRTETVEHHKGQVSFPGGAADDRDSDAVATALRETEEEIGIPPSAIRVLGTMDTFAASSYFRITPVVGYLSTVPPITIQPDEVAEVFYVPLDFFLNPDNETTETRLIDKILRKVYYYRYEGHTIWGITAVMIRQFVRLLSEGIKRN